MYDQVHVLLKACVRTDVKALSWLLAVCLPAQAQRIGRCLLQAIARSFVRGSDDLAHIP